MKIKEIIKSTGKYDLTIFSKEAIDRIENSFFEKIDQDKNFNLTSIIVFGYNFEGKMLREIAENVKLYINKKGVDIDFLMRY